MDIIAERLIGIYFFVIGLTLIITPLKWQEWMKVSKDYSSLNMVFGLMAIILGAFLITVHNTWEISPSIMTTIIGWGALVKGFLFLICPKYIFQLGEKIYKTKLHFRIIGVGIIFLASIIYYYSI